MGDGMLSLSWNNHKATFCHILANLRDKERYTDVTLACEGKFYRVHKLVLSTCSEYFEGMFENTPCKHPVIVLNQIKHDEIEALLSYMYAGVVNVAQSDLARLIKAAELLKIKGLAVPDEPPQESDVRKSQPSSWGSRDERTSPSPKRRRRDDGTPHGGSQTSNSPASSPRASPYMDNSDYGEKSRTQSEGLSSEQRGDKADNRGDPLNTNLDDNDKTSRRTSNEESQPPMIMVDESLVKEEIVDNPDDSRENVLDSGLDFGSLGADKLDASSDGSNSVLPNKFDNPLMPSQSQLPDPVVETLAGPSGMQGWLGDMGGGFPTVDNFRGEGSQQDVRQPLPGQQQPLPMVMSPQQSAIERDTSRWKNGSVTPTSSIIKLYKCPHCSYNTEYSASIKYHMRTHTGEKPFQCTHCPYRANRKHVLMDHIRTHTGEKPFACPQCPFKAGSRPAMNYHIKKHRGSISWT